MNQVDATLKRQVLFGGWILVSVLLFTVPLTNLVRTSLLNGDSSYLIFVPLISAWVFFIDRHKIFLSLSYDAPLGGSLIFCAICAGLFTSLAARDSSSD